MYILLFFIFAALAAMVNAQICMVGKGIGYYCGSDLDNVKIDADNLYVCDKHGSSARFVKACGLGNCKSPSGKDAYCAGAVTVRQINIKGLNLIKEFDGFRTTFYTDSVGTKLIGYAHNCKSNDCSKIHPPITIAQGEALLSDDLKTFETCVEKEVPFVNDNQFAALVSFSYNLGCDALEGSQLLKEVKAKNYQAAADEFIQWIHAGGKVIPGLINRRNAEKALFLS